MEGENKRKILISFLPVEYHQHYFGKGRYSDIQTTHVKYVMVGAIIMIMIII